MRESVKKSQHDALPLTRFQRFQTMREAGRVRRRERLLKRSGVVIHCDFDDRFEIGLRRNCPAPDKIDRAIANDAGHPRHRRAFPTSVVTGVLPDAYKTVLQDLLRPIPSAQYTNCCREQFRRGDAIQLRERIFVSAPALGEQFSEMFRLAALLIGHALFQIAKARRGFLPGD